MKRNLQKIFTSNSNALNKPKTNPYMARPFGLNDLSNVPETWRIGDGPDFVGIAASKSGTSWWHSLLLEHPQVTQNRLNKKELHYFPHFKYFGLNDEQTLTYRMAFAAPEKSICGEWTPSYLLHPFCIEYLSTVASNAKILILLRNPIDRVLSALNHKLQARVKYYGFDSEQHHVYEIFDLQSLEVKSSLYGAGLLQLFRYFERDKVLFLQYEKCILDPLQEIRRTFQFLEIEDSYEPQNLKRAVNQREYSISPCTVEERQRFASYFFDDVNSLVKLFPEIDLSLWKDFSN